MRRDNLADASSSFQKIFNRRHPPRDAKLLDTATFHDIDFVRGTVNYQNPWPETVAKLMEWGDNHGVLDELEDAIYTWSLYNVVTHEILVRLFVYFKNSETRTLFNLSWN